MVSNQDKHWIQKSDYINDCIKFTFQIQEVADMKLKNLSTPWKIGITIGIIISGIIVLGAVSLFGSGSINKRVVNLYTQELKPLISLNGIKGAMYRYRDRTLRFTLEGGDENSVRHIEHMSKQKERVQAGIDKYKETRLSPEEKRHITEFEKKWKEFVNIVENEVIPLVSNNTYETNIRKAENIFFRKALPIFREARDNLNSLIKYQEKRAHRRFQNANKIYSNVMGITWSVIFLVIILAILLKLNLIKSIRVPLSEIQSSMKELSKGNLTVKTSYTSRDEFGQTLNSFSESLKSLNSAIREAKQVANENSNISDELAATAHHVSANVEKMARSVQVIRKEGESVLSTIKEINDGAIKARDVIKGAMKELSETQDKMEEVGNAVKHVADNELELSRGIEKLKERSSEISSIVKMISDIAEQTDILSLNAAIEAARAGDSGRGFTVVAEEVRKLAHKIKQSLNHIQEIISTINESVVEIANQMRKNSGAITDLSKFAEEIGRRFKTMSESMKTADLTYDDILKGFQENKVAVEEIIKQIKEIDQLATGNAKSVEEIATATEHLRDITVELNKRLDRFTT